MATSALVRASAPQSANGGASGLSEHSAFVAEAHSAPFRSPTLARRCRLYGKLVVVDVFSIAIAFVVANLARFGLKFDSTGYEVLGLVLPLYLVIAAHSGAYTLDVLRRPEVGARRATRSFLISIALVIGALFYLKSSSEFSRLVVAYGTALGLVSVFGLRWCIGRYFIRHYDGQFTNELVLVDGVNVFPAGNRPILFIGDELQSPEIGPVLRDRLGKLVRNCDRVIVACEPSRRAIWARVMKGWDVNVEIAAPEVDELGALGMSSLEGRSTFIVGANAMPLRQRLVKRAFDLALTIPTLLLFGPFMLVIALAIKLDSPGPVFFCQERMGKGNRLFRIVKFRTMRAEQSDASGNISAHRDDERITRVGAILRRTSLDELPQLLNVLNGTMSIVGPRPHALGSKADDRLFWDVDPRYWERHVIQPGITGLAQVRGFRGATFAERDLIDRVQADLEYISGWSIWRDIGIIISTFKVLMHKNAF